MDRPTEHCQRQLATPNNTDDESITTSTASDTLDSWTLVTDKKNQKPTKPIYEEESNVEDLPKYEDLDLETSTSTAKEEQENEPSPDHHADTTSATDEFSDEVSIISESESGEVLVPHPYLRKHLQTLNLKFTTGEGLDLASLLQQQQQEEHRLQLRHKEKQTTPPNTPIQLQQSSINNSNNGARQRKRRSPSIDTMQKTLKNQAAPPVTITSQVSCTLQPPRVIRRVYTLFFYFIVALTLLGLYGKLGYWPTFNGDSSASINILEKKLIDMELQNNLMRAEIDLLSKQVNYLKTINPTEHNGERNNKKYKENKEKNPYPNRGPTWTASEGKKAQDTNVKESFENAKESLNIETIYDSNTVNTIEINEYMQKNHHTPDLTESEFRSESTMPVEEIPNQQPIDGNKKEPSLKYYDNDDLVMRERYNKHNSREKRDFASKNEEKFKRRDEKAENFKRQNKKYNSKERYGDDKGEEHKNFKKSSNERHNEKNNSKERKYKKEEKEYRRNNNNNNDNSKERHYRNDNSKERIYKKSDNGHKQNGDSSKEHYYKNEDFKENQQQKRRKSKSGERFDHDKHSGEWHENLMQQREKARNEREHHLKREKNWFLNRNDGREQWRSEEINRR